MTATAYLYSFLFQHVNVIALGSTCSRYAGKDGYFNATDPEFCYVLFPQRNSQATQTWYEARNKCLLEGGDLADENATSLPLPLSSSNRYMIGLRRNRIVWLKTGKRSVQSTARILTTELATIKRKCTQHA